MSWLDGVRHRLYVLAHGEEYAAELERERRFHLELAAMAVAPHGAADHEAELAARRLFGNVTYYGEEVRRMTPLDWLDRVRQDAGYAWRGLKRSPGFTIMVVLTLGLGLGVNAAMFSLLDRLFVQTPHGVDRPREVRRLYHELNRPKEPGGRLAFDGFTYPYLRAINAAEDTALRVAAFTTPESTAVIVGEARLPVRETLVTANYFDVLRVRPERGRFFTGDESRIETPTPVAVLSDALWRRTYAADPAVVGQTISVNYRPFIVIGVAPEGFTGIDIDAVDIWLPANMYPASNPGEPWYETFQNSFRVVARLPDDRLESRFLTVATQALRSVHLKHFEYDSTSRVLAGPIVHALGPAKRDQELSISTRLAGVALIVLFIACANVANLLLLRATRRRREIAVRRALGVSGMRLYEQLLTESLLLATLGGAAALLFAFWAATALRQLLLPKVQWVGGAVDLRTVAFVAVASLVTGMLAGLAPALQATQPDLTNALKAGQREGMHQRSRLRSALLVAQAALSVVLLVGAGLFVKSLRNVRGLDLGYDVEHTLFVRPLFDPGTPPKAELAAALPRIADRLASSPGIEAAAYTSFAPMRGVTFEGLFLPGRDSLPKLGDSFGPSMNAVSPGFLRAAGVRLLAGRDFNSGDRAGSPGVIIVSQTMARLFWPNVNALGQCLIRDQRNGPCSSVVGIVADVHQMAVIEKPGIQYYVPIAQALSEFTKTPREIIIRTSERNAAVASRLVAAELRRAFPSMTTPWIRSMRQSLEPQFRPWQLGATLFTAFGLLALVVAAIGVYSVIAYTVSQRTHEMGVRIALGGRLADILSLVLGESTRIVVAGIALGLVIALSLGRVVSSLLYGISAHDPLVVAGAAVLLGAVGLVASLPPAWRAARVDPVIALRSE